MPKTTPAPTDSTQPNTALNAVPGENFSQYESRIAPLQNPAPIAISSNSSAQAFKTGSNTLDQKLAGQTPQQTSTSQTPSPTNTTTATPPNYSTTTLGLDGTIVQKTPIEKSLQSEAAKSPNSTGDPLYDAVQVEKQQQIDDSNNQLQTEAGLYKGAYDTALKAYDSTYAASVNSINSTTDQAVEVQKQINAQNLAARMHNALSGGNAATGSLEYSNAITNEQQAEATKIKDLETKRQADISSAMAARDTGDQKSLSDYLDKVSTTEDKMRTAAITASSQANDRLTQLQKIRDDQRTKLATQSQSYVDQQVAKLGDAYEYSTDPNERAALVKEIVDNSGGLVSYLDAVNGLNTYITNKQAQTQASLTTQKTIADTEKAKADTAVALSNAGLDNGTSTSTTPGPTPATTAGTAAKNYMSSLGITQDTLLSQAIKDKGIDAVVSAITSNEGSSPTGVKNNPGNIKFQGLPGQTDSGVKAADGGTFANYNTPDSGNKAIADIVTNAANGKSSVYGTAPTLTSFANTYTNTAPQSTGPSFAEYGLLTNTNFNPDNSNDTIASQYLKFLNNGTTPTPRQLGTGLSATRYSIIQKRAEDLYLQATGSTIPDTNTIKANTTIIQDNNTLANSLALQDQTIQANFGLNLANLTANNINSAWPILNNVINNFNSATGDPATAQYLAQNSTIQNELGSLLAVKNASGTTVHDKLESAGLLPKNATPEQQVAIVKTLLQEAGNSKSVIDGLNMQLYQKTDPLMINGNNPIRPFASDAASGKPITLRYPDGSQHTNTLTPKQLDDAIRQGFYPM